MMQRLITFGLSVAIVSFGLAVATVDPASAQESKPPSTKPASPDSRPADQPKAADRSATQTAGDSWITMKTKLSLFADERVSATDVNVDTKAGVVTLRGKVPSAEAKQAAEGEAKKIDGVKRVVNQLTVVPPAKQKAVERKDEQITQDVEKRLKQDKSLKSADIDVETSNGIVTLKGEAPSLRASVHASEVAHRVAGVRAVQNDLNVKEGDKRG